MNCCLCPKRLSVVVVLPFFLLGGHVVRAELTVVNDAEGQDGLTVYKMTVTPAPEPKPALKHRLTIRPNERQPGNAASHYLRSFAENSLEGPWKRIRDKFGSETIDGWYGIDLPIGELPLAEVREAAGAFDSYVEYFIAPASKCRDCEWGLAEEYLDGTESIFFRLPDAQQSREICRALALRTRLAIAERRYDDAIEHMRMNYQLGQDIARQKFLVCSLIGIAEVGISNKTMIDLIAAPDSPNMFWALTELPRPIVGTREAIRLEMSLGQRIFPELLNIEHTEHSPEEWARLIREGMKAYRDVMISEGQSLPQFEPAIGFTSLGASLMIYPGAKQRLIQSGLDTTRVDQMAVGQVLLLDASREYRRIADEFEKWWYIDFPQARYRMDQESALFPGNYPQGGFGEMIAALLLPAVQAARKAEMRTEWQLQALRVVEAIRMHAAETGALPQSLGEITVVPPPLNPVTLEPYQYRLDGQTAVLDLPFSDGMSGIAWRFEITLAE